LAFLDHAERVLQADATKLVLSFLIILSVLPAATLAAALPPELVARLDLVFLALFVPEFALRLATWLRRHRRRRAAAWEPVLLAADLLALISFLPLHGMFRDLAYFRLFRLTRLLLLLGYWGEMVADLWAILSGRERRYQVVFVLLIGLVLSFAGAVILAEFAPEYDYNQDGAVDAADRAFHQVLWWSFRQLPDPGNLAVEPKNSFIVAISLLMTSSGLLLFSFLIGISAGAMDELMRRSQERPPGLRNHTVILGLGPYSFFLLEELAEIYRKNRKAVRGIVLGPTPDPPDYFRRRRQAYAYRHGDPVNVSDLDRVDIDQAKRVIVQAGPAEEPDAKVISAILAARARNHAAYLFPDLEHEKNFHAARAAGGAHTHVIGSGPFLGYYVAQNVIYPGVYRAYRQLLTTIGAEVYTYVFDVDERRRLRETHAVGLDPGALFASARLAGVTTVGVFVDRECRASCEVEELEVLLNPLAREVPRRSPHAFGSGGALRAEALGGLIGVALRWEDLRAFASALVQAPPSTTLARAPGPAGLELRLPAPAAERVLICGASLRVPRVIVELIQFFGPLEVTVLVREEAHLRPLADAVESALEGYLTGLPEPREPPWVLSAAAAAREFRVQTAAGGATVRILHADWSDAALLLRHPQVDLSRTDALLFLPREGGEAADGMVALDCLRIAHFGQCGAVRFRPGFRVLGKVRDPVKSDLLERRLDQMAGPGAKARFTIISSERIRNHFMVQNIFVRGLNAVYLELLDGCGQHFCRLVPHLPPAEGESDLDELTRHLAAERGLLLIGFERAAADGSTEVLLDPRALGSGQRVAWSALRALYVVGEGRALLSRA
jgi:hypothetical protein